MATPGIYNVVDDEPAPVSRVCRSLAGALGRQAAAATPALARPGSSAARLATVMMTEIRGASNAKAKRELGWQPQLPELAAGLPPGLA